MQKQRFSRFQQLHHVKLCLITAGANDWLKLKSKKHLWTLILTGMMYHTWVSPLRYFKSFWWWVVESDFSVSALSLSWQNYDSDNEANQYLYASYKNAQIVLKKNSWIFVWRVRNKVKSFISFPCFWYQQTFNFCKTCI